MEKTMKAFDRLLKTLEAVAADPHHPGAQEALENAAYEANHELADHGLVERKERPQSS